MNKLTIIGNLTRDPELRSVNTVNGPVSVCDFTVAVNSRRRGGQNNGQQQDDTQFFRCTAWRGLADVISRYATKGTKVCVIGPVSARTYTGNDGNTRVSLEVTVEDFEFASSRSAEGAAAPAPQGEMSPTAQNSDFTPAANEDLPF
ncbi:MAG: single-stranded DNA-binding protein [Clostridia bacterium]|nr:single-stranded DNA-binding protein [Clostridia bacterium]